MGNRHTKSNGNGAKDAPRNGAVINLRAVQKDYKVAARTFTALREVELEIQAGEFVAIVGKSGSGKSTLLNVLAGIDTPTTGEVWIAGTPVHALTQDQLAAWRGKTIGVVFQFFQLLPTLTVVENVMLPMDFGNTTPANGRKQRALALLDQVGIAAHANKLPALLSGGEQQRAAIARALANDPAVILADEPTGNLDSNTADGMLEFFKSLAASGKTVVMATHERDAFKWVSRTVTLADGRIVSNAIVAYGAMMMQAEEATHV